jgi:hypothetical protein
VSDVKKNLGIAIGTVVAGYACRKIIAARRLQSSEARMLDSGGHRETDTRLVAEPGRSGAAARVLIPTAMAAGGITIFSKMSHGNTLRYTFVPTLAGSWLLYILVLRRRRPDTDRLMPLYFVSLAWQFVHFIEENQTGFRYRWPIEIFGAEPYGDKQYVAINVLSYALFILGGVALMVDRREFSLPAVFFAVMGVMFNGVQHPIYAWMVKGYFPGLWTSSVDLVLGPMLLKRLFAPQATEPHLI